MLWWLSQDGKVHVVQWNLSIAEQLKMSRLVKYRSIFPGQFCTQHYLVTLDSALIKDSSLFQRFYVPL